MIPVRQRQSPLTMIHRCIGYLFGSLAFLTRHAVVRDGSCLIICCAGLLLLLKVCCDVIFRWIILATTKPPFFRDCFGASLFVSRATPWWEATNDDTEAELGRVSEGLSVVSQNMANLFAMVLLNCNRRSGFSSRGSEQRAEACPIPELQRGRYDE